MCSSYTAHHVSWQSAFTCQYSSTAIIVFGEKSAICIEQIVPVRAPELWSFPNLKRRGGDGTHDQVMLITGRLCQRNVVLRSASTLACRLSSFGVLLSHSGTSKAFKAPPPSNLASLLSFSHPQARHVQSSRNRHHRDYPNDFALLCLCSGGDMSFTVRI